MSQREHLADSAGETLVAMAEVCRALAAETAAAVREGVTPLVLGGDHLLAMGSVAGVATALAERGERVGLIWLDAHGDINTPDTSASGNLHGMPVAHLLGLGDRLLSMIATPHPALRPEQCVMVGLRDLDPPERTHIRDLGITAFTMREIDERGLQSVMSDAITIASAGTGGIHVSCDPDWIDPSDAPGVGTPVRGGATFREAHRAGDGRRFRTLTGDGPGGDQSGARSAEPDGRIGRRPDRERLRRPHPLGSAQAVGRLSRDHAPSGRSGLRVLDRLVHSDGEVGMARPSDLDRVADRGDGPAGEIVGLLVFALDADGHQQLNRFAHCPEN